MIYQYQYGLAAAVCLSIVIFHFYSQNRFPVFYNRVFEVIMLLIFTSTILDVITAFTITYRDYFSVETSMILLTVYYLSEHALPYLFLLYAMGISGRTKYAVEHKREMTILSIPMFITMLLIATNFAHQKLFIFDEVHQYTHGPWYWIVLADMAFYLVPILVVLIQGQRNIPFKEKVAAFVFFVIITLGVGLQFMLPNYLVQGACMCFAVIALYVTGQNPGAMLDDLTGAFSRKAFMMYLNDARAIKKPLYIMHFDLDRLSDINKSVGMLHGDRLLADIAKEIILETKKGYLFRVQGGAFYLVSRKNTCKENCDKVKEIVERPRTVHGVPISVSICATYYKDFELTKRGADYVLMADALMEKAKAKGRGTHLLVNQKMINEIGEALEMQRIIKEALDEKRFEAYMQPIYSFREKKFTNCEALARLFHDSLGQISPGIFVPVLEKMGLIAELDKQIREQTYEFFTVLRDMPENTIKHIEVNLSPMSLFIPGLENDIIAKEEFYNIEASDIIYEITETMAVNMESGVMERMARLKDEGGMFAIDDFGTGYSNLAKILEMPFSIAKLDRSIVVKGTSDSTNRQVLQSIVDIIKKIGWKIVAEGVETEEQADILEMMGVDYAQGFYFARPMSQEDLKRLLCRSYQQKTSAKNTEQTS